MAITSKLSVAIGGHRIDDPVTTDVAALGKSRNPGQKKAVNRIVRRAKRAVARGEPLPEHLAVYADYISGLSMRQVEEKHGYSSSKGKTVSYIVKKIDQWLIPQLMGDIRRVKCQHEQRLMHIFCEAMAAWERSKRDKVQFEHERDIDGKMVLSKIKREPQTGNPAFIATAMKALEDIRAILGADAPLRVQHGGELRVSGGTLDQARAEFADKLEQAAADVRQRLTATSAN